ncbi:MAG: NAD-dependent epimerase/dehydratase family protein [Patescibacteria group bacterium]|mgnify:FL=1
MAKYKTALVTGGAGFIGSHLVDALVRRRIKVYVIDDLSTGQMRNVNPNAEFIKMSITSPKLASIVKKIKPDVIFHYAAQRNVRVSLKHPIYDAEVNVMGTLALIQAAYEVGVKKFIFSSSGGAIYSDAHKHRAPWSEEVVDEPVSPYGVAKRAGELYLNFAYYVQGMSYVALRYANIYGPRQDSGGEGGAISIFISRMLKNQAVQIFGNGKQTRDFVYVDDAVAAALKAMDAPVVGVYNIGTGQEVNVNTFFYKIKKLTGSDVAEKHVAANAGEILRSVLDARLARKKLDWTAKVSFDEGLRRTVEWFRAQK